MNKLDILLGNNQNTNVDASIAIKVLMEFIEKSDEHCLPYRKTPDFMESLLYNYFAIKGTKDEVLIEELLKKYNMDYSVCIHNALYYLLCPKDNHFDRSISPYKWPGIYDIKKRGTEYHVETILGMIHVHKASRVFSQSKSIHLFRKQLASHCYERSFEFLQENQDYKVVLCNRPNFFAGKNYHVFLEKEEHTLDISSNAFYTSKESANKVLSGDILAKLTYDEVLQEISVLSKEYENVDKHFPLYVLSLKHNNDTDTLSML